MRVYKGQKVTSIKRLPIIEILIIIKTKIIQILNHKLIIHLKLPHEDQCRLIQILITMPNYTSK